MAPYIRPLTARDLDQCDVVESSAFPPDQAASRNTIEYRLTVCPEVCYGLFVSKDSKTPIQLPAEIPILDATPEGEDAVLVAHTLATKSTTRGVRDEDMASPENWKADPQAEYDVGSKKNGKTIALHALAVAPAHQRGGLGKALTKAYIEQMKKTNQGDRVSILTYDKLVPYYEKLGFTHYGKSESNYAGVAWHDLAYEF